MKRGSLAILALLSACVEVPNESPGEIDAAINSPPDANADVLLIEAENFDSKQSLDGVHDWVFEASLPGFSGNGYINARPEAPYINCQTDGACAAVFYNLQVSQPGDYSIYLRMAGDDMGSDSILWGLSGTEVVVHDLIEDGNWNWELLTATPLSGTTTLELQMREPAVRIDQLYIAPPGMPPPD